MIAILVSPVASPLPCSLIRAHLLTATILSTWLVRGAWPAGWVHGAALDCGVEGSSPVLGVEVT